MYEFRAFGQVVLKAPDGTSLDSILTRPKRLALLAYLTIGSPSGARRRDSLLSIFWPELDTEHARRALRQALYVVRHELGDGAVKTRGAEEILIDPEVFWSDTGAFADAYEVGDFATALELYRGDLLVGFHVPEAADFERWLEDQRGRFKSLAAKAARQLSERSAAEGDLDGAIDAAHRSCELSPYDEDALRHFLKLLDQHGDRGDAMRAYETFATRLQTELEVDPSPETRALVDAIRARKGTNRSVMVADPGSLPEASTVSPEATVVRVRAGKRTLLVAAAVLAALIVGIIGRGILQRSPTPIPIPNRVIVLPFENVNGGPTSDDVGTRAAETIAIALASSGIVEVATFTSLPLTDTLVTVPSGGPTADPLSVARANRAQLVVSGTYRSDPDSVGIIPVILGVDFNSPDQIAPLVDSRDNISDLLALVADRVVATIMARDRRRAIEWFLRAASLDSSFTDAQLWAALELNHTRSDSLKRLADSLIESVADRRDKLSPTEASFLDYVRAVDRRADRGESIVALEAIRRVVRLRPTRPYLYEAASAAGDIRRYRELLQYLERVEPDSAIQGGWLWYWGNVTASYHMLREHEAELASAKESRTAFPEHGRSRELRALAALGAADELRAVLDNQPTAQDYAECTRIGHAANELHAHGHEEAMTFYEDALSCFLAALDANRASGGDYSAYLTWIMQMALSLGRINDARDALQPLLRDYPDHPTVLGLAGLVAVAEGDSATADRLLLEIEASQSEERWRRCAYPCNPLKWRAAITAAQGNLDRAVGYLQALFAAGLGANLTAHQDPDLRALWGFEPFRALYRARD